MTIRNFLNALDGCPDEFIDDIIAEHDSRELNALAEDDETIHFADECNAMYYFDRD